MRLLFVLALVFTAHAQDPACPEGGDCSPPEPTTGRAAPLAPADAVLDTATRLLALGRYNETLEIALPAISTYPARAASFDAIARIAADQLARGRGEVVPASGVAVGAPASVATPDPAAPGAPDARYLPPELPAYLRKDRPNRADDSHDFRYGFELGSPSGLRGEWHANGSVIDGVGLRVGVGLLFYSGTYLSPTINSYLDFQSRNDWQFELSIGTVVYYGTPYGMTGIAAQYDPDSPWQASFGLNIGGYGMVHPDVSVAYMW